MTKKNASKLAPAVFTANGLDTDCPLSEVVDKPIRNHDDNGRFIAGNNLGQGRPIGSRNLLTEDFVEDFRTVWKESGIKAIRIMAEKEPSAFVKCAASLMPKDLLVDLKGEIDHTHSTASRPVSATLEWIQSVLDAKPVRTLRTPGN